MGNAMVALGEAGEAARLTAMAAALVAPGDEVSVLHVLDSGSEPARTEAEAAVADAVGRLRSHGLSARGDLAPPGPGSVADRLAERATAAQADLVVIGSRGLGHLGGLFGRSVSHALLANLEVPVLIVPANALLPEQGFRRVLAAVEDEDQAQAAAGAIRMLRRPVEVLAVHVPRLVATHVGEAPGETFVELGETSPRVLACARRLLRNAGIRAATRTLSRSAGVASAITDVAREWGADLVVLGSRRLHDWEAVFAGSTSHAVLRLSGRPVLVAGRTTVPEASRPRRG